MRSISDGTWEEWQRDRAAGADWATNIHPWTRTKKGDVTTRWRGVLSAPDEHGTQEKLNIYFFLIDEYHGLLGNGREERPGDN